ncbi:MAG: dUTP diphosphatase [Acholeplasmatales bacterium]|nr:dUTP diphosphatase [Methanobrevibacter sp.]MBP5446455.1 dUTP diphosphatase [Acholeplasmatales bacterium]
MIVKIKKLNENAVIPSYAKKGDAGMDLTATSYEYDENHKNHIYGTGLAIEIPEGYVGLVFPRSSNRKTSAYLTNHVGIIDSGYRGEIMLTFKDRDALMIDMQPYAIGDRIGQIMILPYPQIVFTEVETLSSSERGTGGHGSTGS